MAPRRLQRITAVSPRHGTERSKFFSAPAILTVESRAVVRWVPPAGDPDKSDLTERGKIFGAECPPSATALCARNSSFYNKDVHVYIKNYVFRTYCVIKRKGKHSYTQLIVLMIQLLLEPLFTRHFVVGATNITFTSPASVYPSSEVESSSRLWIFNYGSRPTV